MGQPVNLDLVGVNMGIANVFIHSFRGCFFSSPNFQPRGMIF